MVPSPVQRGVCVCADERGAPAANPNCTQSGAAIMLQSLLIVLLGWAREEHVPLRAGALAAAEAALALPDMGMPSIPGRAIFAFLKAVEVPVLVLCGGYAWRGVVHAYGDLWLGHSTFVLVHFVCAGPVLVRFVWPIVLILLQ